MLLHLLMLPFKAARYSTIKMGLFWRWLCLGAIIQDIDLNFQFVLWTAYGGLFILTFPIYLIVFAVIFPTLLVTRIY